MVAPFTEGGRHPKTQARVRLFNALSPARLFANGEQGAWYDPSDLTTLYQDSAGTTPVTADGDPVGRMEDKSGNGNHVTQATSAARPLYRTDGTLHWLEFDGTDDFLTSTTFPATAQPVVYAVGLEILAPSNILDGRGNASERILLSDGSMFAGTSHTYAQAITGKNVIVAQFDFNSSEIRRNGQVYETGFNVGSNSRVGLTIGTDYNNFPYANMKLYDLVVKDLSLYAPYVDKIESYLAQKSGVTL